MCILICLMTSRRSAEAFDPVAKKRCARGASSGVTRATSKRRDSGLCLKSIARSGGAHFFNCFRTEQFALCICKRRYWVRADETRPVRLIVECDIWIIECVVKLAS